MTKRPIINVIAGPAPVLPEAVYLPELPPADVGGQTVKVVCWPRAQTPMGVASLAATRYRQTLEAWSPRKTQLDVLE